MEQLVAPLMQLFEGFDKAYGIYKLTGEVQENGKQKGQAASLKGEVVRPLWEKHLNGEQGLGIIPINNDSKCKFAAIDIDEYPLDLIALNKNIIDNQLPLVLCRTKSGGAHLYMFLNEWLPAKVVRKKMKEFSAFLGYGSAEIYPIQEHILVERGDVGQWINMPYFNQIATMRYGLNERHKAMPLDDFIRYAQSKSVGLAELEQITVAVPEILPGGPPCIQRIIQQGGFPEGTRNNGLFNLGVYAMKSDPDNWAARLEELNNKHMDPPLSVEEVLGVVKSLKKKDYQYTCNAQPMAGYCNKSVCRQCKFGIGGGGIGLPVFGSLTKIETIPPVWFLDVEGGGRLMLSTDDLQSPMSFQLRCMETLNTMPVIPKREDWTMIVGKLLAKVNIVSVPVEATPKGIMFSFLEEFLTSRVQANVADEILMGKPWKSGKYYHFRLKDFMAFLDRKKFYDLKKHQIVVYMTDFLKAQTKFMNLSGKGANVYIVPVEFFTQQDKSFETPKVTEAVQY
jgi:hypothetical protein